MFLIVECIVFGMFAFAILCEQINSITDEQHSVINNRVGHNGVLSHSPSLHLPSKSTPSLSSSPSSSQVISSSMAILNTSNLKRQYTNNLYLFRRVFRVDNPLLWLLPFEFSSMKYQKQSSQDNVV